MTETVGKVWKIVSRGGRDGVTEYAVAASTKSAARQAFLAANIRAMRDAPVVVRDIPEALERPGVVFRKDWRSGDWIPVTT